MLSILFFILFSASVAGIAYLVLRKAPILSRISQESLVDQETFAAWMARSARRIFFLLHPGRIRMHLFAQAAHILNAVRVLFFKMYHTIETM
ncbi:hypothetical protein HYR65_03460, partial [Candidatus Azambacteria bacterium]|nr:hypothetical protein [Candidatus Azambacteria bacterium]